MQLPSKKVKLGIGGIYQANKSLKNVKHKKIYGILDSLKSKLKIIYHLYKKQTMSNK